MSDLKNKTTEIKKGSKYIFTGIINFFKNKCQCSKNAQASELPKPTSKILFYQSAVMLFKFLCGFASFAGFFLGAFIFKKYFPEDTFRFLIKCFIVVYVSFFPLMMLTVCFLYFFKTKKNESGKERKTPVEDETIKKFGPQPVDELLYLDLISIDIGKDLVCLVDPSQGSSLLEHINGVRNLFAIDTGLVVPPIRIRDNIQLEACEYNFKIKGNLISTGTCYPGDYLIMNSSGGSLDVEGTETHEPAFNLPAKWIKADEKKRAGELGYTVVDAATVLSTHLKEIIKKYGFELLTRPEVKKMIEKISKQNPGVVEGIIPEKISLAKVHRILQNLLKQQVSIRDTLTIFEIIGDCAEENQSSESIIEHICSALYNQSIHKH